MMECSCNISMNDGECAEFASEKIVTARKTHLCCECRKKIQPGEKYEYVSGVWEGRFEHYKTCLDCVSMRKSFFHIWVYTDVWESFKNEMDCCAWQVPESCMAKLTPGARAKVCEMIEQYWDEGEE